MNLKLKFCEKQIQTRIKIEFLKSLNLCELGRHIKQAKQSNWRRRIKGVWKLMSSWV